MNGKVLPFDWDGLGALFFNCFHWGEIALKVTGDGGSASSERHKLMTSRASRNCDKYDIPVTLFK